MCQQRSEVDVKAKVVRQPRHGNAQRTGTFSKPPLRDEPWRHYNFGASSHRAASMARSH